MAWTEKSFEKTFHTVDNVPNDAGATRSETDRLRKIFEDMPPFIKITSRRARKTLAIYETLKERRTEALRENLVFKFVMMVAGLTNDRIETFWKGNSVDPFSDRQTPISTKIDKQDLKLLMKRARERAFADLHQFCGRIKAVPMYRRAITEPLDFVDTSGAPLVSGDTYEDTPLLNAQTEDIGQDREAKRQRVVRGAGRKGADTPPPASKIKSKVKYIYNMSDTEFDYFIKRFQKQGFPGPNDLRWYVLGRDIGGREHPQDNGESPFRAHRHFRGQTYGSRTDRIYDHQRVFGPHGQKDSYDHPDEYATLPRSNWWEWAQNVPIVRWEQERPEFWFQRYVARWLREAAKRTVNLTGESDKLETADLKLFGDRFQGVFNNLTFDKDRNAWIRDLTGLRLTKMIREEYEDTKETIEGGKDMDLPCEPACEVPLDFVRPLFNERYAYWKHELVLGEYEKRSMYQADQWLQKTPWAIGKIYLQPSIYAHMQEAHVAICARYKKFKDLSLQDWLGTDKHRFFFSKLVALCIRTSAVLSNKRYGLDKVYMRLNLEKKRIMYAIGKLETPTKMQTTVTVTVKQQQAWNDYAAARKSGDSAAAVAALNKI
jgi:hypothetical protein